MKPLSYELIAHTADIGIKVKAPDLKGLFITAGLAVFDICSRKISTARAPVTRFPIALTAEKLDELFIGWLNELISLSASAKVIISSITIDDLSDTSLRGQVSGESVDAYRLEKEIKGATYHGLKLAQTAGGWEAEVIFDV